MDKVDIFELLRHHGLEYGGCSKIDSTRYTEEERNFLNQLGEIDKLRSWVPIFSLTDPADFNRLSQDLFNLISDEDDILVL